MTTTTTYRCARCNRRLKDGDWVYSQWTKSRFCSDLDACGKRARRTKKEA